MKANDENNSDGSQYLNIFAKLVAFIDDQF